MADHLHVLHSWDEARAQVAVILGSLNRDPALLLAALANPLLAMQEIGFEVAPGARQAFEDRIRFGEAGAQRLHELRQALEALPGLPTHEAGLRQHLADLAGIPAEAAREVDALLEQCRSRHPQLDALIEYRALQRSRPPFASPALYGRIRRGAAGPLPFTRVRARLHGVD